MKKATDKIYLATTEEIQSLDSSFVGIAHSDPEDIIEPIEYVRTDAFIEKAAKWLEDNAIEYWGTEAVYNGMMIDDFKKAMKLWN